MRPRRLLPAALALAACAARPPSVAEAHAPPLLEASALSLWAPARAEGRVGAVQLEVRLRNAGGAPVRLVADPGLAELAVRGPGGPVRCAAPAPVADLPPAVSLAPGAELPLRIDLSGRCRLEAAGEYEVEVAFPAADAPTPRAVTRVAVAERTWVNPGPVPQRPAGR